MNNYKLRSLILVSFLLSFTYKGFGNHNIIVPGNPLSSLDSVGISGNQSIDSLTTDSTQIIKVDTLKPIYQKGLLGQAEHGTIFKKENFYRSDYRYTGDLVKYLPFGFVYDLGSLGQPNEASIYGFGFQNTSYLVDGISFTNRITNSLDLNNVQSENINQLEIIPLARGFIYGSANNPATVNFNMKDTVNTVPYSRIRFYQAPDEESYLDASFGAYLVDKLNFSFSLTSNAIDSRFDNSDYGGWKASTRIRYMFSNKINLIASYHYIKSEAKLNGGIDALDKNNVNYDNLQSEVIYPTVNISSRIFPSRFQKYTQHNVLLKLLGKFIKEAPTNLTFYYLFNNTEFRQNERTGLANIPTIINDNQSKTIGLRLRQNISIKPIELEIISNYENIDFDTGILKDNSPITSFSIAGVAKTTLLDGQVVPSAFTKYLNYDGKSYFGLGADLNYKFSNSTNLYAGVSRFERDPGLIARDLKNNSSQPSKQSISNLEIGVKFNSQILNGTISFFNSGNDNNLFYAIGNNPDTLIVNEANQFFVEKTDQNGLNLNLNLRFWKLLISLNSNYYLDKEENKSNLPDYNGFMGLYYIDTLFNTNLKLKAGANFYYYGGQSYFTYDLEKSVPIKYFNNGSSFNLIKNESSDPSFQLDLFLAGQFQDSAILYITYENILGKEYYLVPYYPKQGSGFRFGISWEFLN